MTNENLQQDVTQDGSEYIINTINGDASLSVSAASRVLKTARSTIKSALTRLKIETVSAKIVTTTGLRTVSMINSADLYELAKEFQPILSNINL